MVSRRNVILGVGGTLALVGAGAAWRVMRVPQKAYLPWAQAGRTEHDPRLDVFRHAILAPNPHNMQPWQIRLIGTDQAEISCDLARRLPQTDPFDRQIVIGFGCFVELAVIAASRHGMKIDVETFPEGAGEERLDDRPVARLRFVAVPGLEADPLAGFIRDRRSAKVPFDLKRPVPSETLAALQAAGSDLVRFDCTRTESEVQALIAMASTAFEREMRTPHTLRESIDVLRVGASEIEANPDGISLRGPLFEALSILGADKVRADAMDSQSETTTNQIARYRQIFTQTPSFVWLTGLGNSRAHQLAAGRSYLRLNLLATKLGLGLHPISQALQEYPEMTPLFAEARRLCRVETGETLQMLARLGYADPVAPTPRWPLEAKLIRA
ncbi:twin-arginine translocation pathway signal protein [Rhabdaerophilum sp. SD176]|uniref:Acg family FMN-binding oxidoreductase n=1 Tax=Rhabdaerophilum sp. SD176 TaxID=2983548 RepID=UPI0024E01F33|nr:twin-arginine translocation pathway signal protein [Rhabdaerophilum sp. SD176]